jgi:hypothetical protein
MEDTNMRSVLRLFRNFIFVLLLMPLVLVASNAAMDAITYSLRDYCAKVDDNAYICVRYVTSPLDRQVQRGI